MGFIQIHVTAPSVRRPRAINLRRGCKLRPQLGRRRTCIILDASSSSQHNLIVSDARGRAGNRGRETRTGPQERRSASEFNRQITTCARRRDLNGALRVLEQLDNTVDVSRDVVTYNAIINAMITCNQRGRAKRFWNEMVQAGIDPNRVTFNTMLKSFFGGTDEDVSRAFQMLQRMEDLAIPCDRVTFNTVINICVSAGRLSDAQQVYQQMRGLYIEPDSYTFCTLAKQARKTEDVSMLDALLLHLLSHHTKLRQEKHAEPLNFSSNAYNSIANAYIRCGHPERALRLLEKMRNPADISETHDSVDGLIAVRPDVQTYNVRIKALRESGAPVHQALDVVKEMQSVGLEEDFITLITLIDFCCQRNDMPTAEAVLQTAIDSDLSIFQSQRDKSGSRFHTSGESSEAVDGNISDPRAFSDNSFEKEKRRNLYRQRAPRSPRGSQRYTAKVHQPKHAKASTGLYNALIRGYTSSNVPDVERAIELFREMEHFAEKYGFSYCLPDSVTFTLIVNGCARSGNTDQAEKIISEMEAIGISNVIPYNAYLKATREKGVDTTMSILRRIRSRGLRPDIITYNTVIDSVSGVEHGLEIAEKLILEQMPKEGVEPDLLTFNTMIKGAARRRAGAAGNQRASLEAAEMWLEELKSRGLKPDAFTYQGMLSACAADGDAETALLYFRLIQEIQEKRGKARTAQNTASQSGSPSGQASSTRPHYQTKNWTVPLHRAAYVTLMRAFLASNAKDRIESVMMVRDEMAACGMELGQSGYTAVADAYAERADIYGVDSTLADMFAHTEEPWTGTMRVVHHCIRMKAFCNARQLQDAFNILKEVEDADTPMYNTLIFACIRNKKMDMLMEVLRLMEARNREPDWITDRALRMMMGTVAQSLKSVDNRLASAISRAIDLGKRSEREVQSDKEQ